MQGKHMLSRTLDSLRKPLSPFIPYPIPIWPPTPLTMYIQYIDVCTVFEVGMSKSKFGVFVCMGLFDLIWPDQKDRQEKWNTHI